MFLYSFSCLYNDMKKIYKHIQLYTFFNLGEIMFKIIKNFFDRLQWKYICWRVFEDNKKKDKRK